MCKFRSVVMTYSYSSPLTYGSQNSPVHYEGTRRNKPSAIPAIATGAVLGGGAGAYIGSRKNPYISKTGEALDSFAENVYKKFAKNAGGITKEAYEGSENLLKKINGVKTPEELKTLFEANKEAAKDICTELKQSSEEFLNKITKENLAANKKVIKDKIQAGNQTRIRDIKNQIQVCWDKESKKFVKADNVKDDVFEAIKKSTNKTKFGNIAKYSAIGAGIAAVLGFITYKLLNMRNDKKS